MFYKPTWLDLPYCRPLSVTRRRIPGFVAEACVTTNSKARSAVSISTIDLHCMFDKEFQRIVQLETM